MGQVLRSLGWVFGVDPTRKKGEREKRTGERGFAWLCDGGVVARRSTVMPTRRRRFAATSAAAIFLVGDGGGK